MNSLSWMIYAADVLSNIGGLLLFLAIASMIISVGVFIFAGPAIGIWDEDDRQYKHAKAALGFVLSKWWVPLVCGFLWAVIPSQNTIYMIAASEAGETIVKTPEAQEIFNDLKTIIRQKLKEQITVPATTVK